MEKRQLLQNSKDFIKMYIFNLQKNLKKIRNLEKLKDVYKKKKTYK